MESARVTDQMYDGIPKRIPRVFRLRCCDCALTHTMQVDPLPNGIRLTVWRDKRVTKRSRKLKKYQHVRMVAWAEHC
jgi:hypothetical protein